MVETECIAENTDTSDTENEDAATLELLRDQLIYNISCSKSLFMIFYILYQALFVKRKERFVGKNLNGKELGAGLSQRK